MPEEVAFAPKPTLARGMIGRTLEAGARLDWVVADSVYGGDGKLRFWLEALEQPHVMAVTSKQSVCIGFEKKAVKAFLSRLQAQDWKVLSAGAGTKGPRLFDWAALRLNHPYDPARWQRFLLLRRSRSQDREITFYLACAPAGTSLEQLARVAGGRWATRGELRAEQRRGGPGSVGSAQQDRLASTRDSGHDGSSPAGHYPRQALCQ
jgi:SRSO17 transposase